MTIEEKLEKMGLTLPPAPGKGGVYASVKSLGNNFYYISGCGSYIEGEGPQGKLGQDLTIEEGQEAAKRTILNYLSVIKAHIGSLDKVKSFVNAITQFEFDFDLISGRYVIDAKSIMGIFSLDLSKPIDLAIHAESNMDEIMEVLKPYLV